MSTGGADTGKSELGLYKDSQYTGGTSFSVTLNETITGISDSGEEVTVSQEGVPGGGGPGQGGPGGSGMAPTGMTAASKTTSEEGATIISI